MKQLSLILIGFLFISCTENRRPRLAEKQLRFVHIYTELLQLKEKPFGNPTAHKDSSTAILNKYQYTQQEYDQMLAYFNEKPERWEVFYKEVLEQLKRNKASPQQKKHP